MTAVIYNERIVNERIVDKRIVNERIVDNRCCRGNLIARGAVYMHVYGGRQLPATKIPESE